MLTFHLTFILTFFCGLLSDIWVKRRSRQEAAATRMKSRDHCIGKCAGKKTCFRGKAMKFYRKSLDFMGKIYGFFGQSMVFHGKIDGKPGFDGFRCFHTYP